MSFVSDLVSVANGTRESTFQQYLSYESGFDGTIVETCQKPIFSHLKNCSESFALSIDVLNEIFSYLHPEALARAGRVCRKWLEGSKEQMLWKQIVKEEYPFLEQMTDCSGDWRTLALDYLKLKKCIKKGQCQIATLIPKVVSPSNQSGKVISRQKKYVRTFLPHISDAKNNLNFVIESDNGLTTNKIIVVQTDTQERIAEIVADNQIDEIKQVGNDLYYICRDGRLMAWHIPERTQREIHEIMPLQQSAVFQKEFKLRIDKNLLYIIEKNTKIRAIIDTNTQKIIDSLLDFPQLVGNILEIHNGIIYYVNEKQTEPLVQLHLWDIQEMRPLDSIDLPQGTIKDCQKGIVAITRWDDGILFDARNKKTLFSFKLENERIRMCYSYLEIIGDMVISSIEDKLAVWDFRNKEYLGTINSVSRVYLTGKHHHYSNGVLSCFSLSNVHFIRGFQTVNQNFKMPMFE